MSETAQLESSTGSIPQEQQAPSAEATPKETASSEQEEAAALEAEMEKAGLSEAEKRSLRKKFQLKVNNKIKDIEVDLGNEEEVKKYLQKALAADEKFQESAQIRKAMENLILALKSDPLSVLTHPDLGINVKDLAEMVLAKEIEESQKSPEQKKIEELEKMLREKEEMAKRLEEEKYAAELQKLEQQIYEDLNKQIIDALSNSNLPKSPRVIKRIGSVMRDAILQGYENVTVKDIIPYVEQQFYQEVMDVLESVGDDKLPSMLEKVVGKKNLDRYRKAIVGKIKAKVPDKPNLVETKKDATESKSNVQPMTIRDLMKY
ncbi:MAG: hypothetical protein ABIM30_01175 [candidate division WOR-3 bacterium]